MILIPDIETVVILVPRAGSTSILTAVKKRYPRAIVLYRHMEADGVPYAYDRYKKVAVIRNPLDRLWSLYKYMDRLPLGKYEGNWTFEMRKQTRRDFEDWVLNNQSVFTYQYDPDGTLKTDPFYAVNHPLPENRKSQFLYARPDLGTELYRFDNLKPFADDLDIEIPCLNGSHETEPVEVPNEIHEYMDQVFAWDYNFLIYGRKML